MTGSTELSSSDDRLDGSPGSAWRRERELAQERAVPAGSAAVTCSAALGAGGLGRHFEEVIDALARREQPTVAISGAARGGGRPERAGERVRSTLAPARLLARMPLQSARGWGARAFFAEFDDYAAARLPRAQHLIAFNGQALHQLRAARSTGYQSVSLVSANSHLSRVVRQHARAHRQYPLERSWAERLLRRNLAEYARCDRIFVASQYTRESFLAEGVRAERLSLFPFTPSPRFVPARSESGSSTFDIVYTGSLTVAKGVPLLIDAVRRLAHPDIRLHLVGGWSTPGMRRFVQQACQEDGRIAVAPGDPLPLLQVARLCVHPSYEDGFAYAPVEAMACGVPVIVSEDTGMKELVSPGRDGAILATGDLSALTAAIDAAYRGELFDSPSGTSDG